MPTITQYAVPLKSLVIATFLSSTFVATHAYGARVNWSEERDQFAPAIEPELLFASIYGGRGDQWFPQVGIRRNRVVAANREGLGIQVTINDDGTISARGKGNPGQTSSRIQTSLPNGGRAGPFTYGYNQVHPILQQPFLRVGGREVWGWTNEQARGAKARYAPYMADSRIRHVIVAPNGNGIAIGTADGGNTCFQAHPYDINRNFDAGVGYNVTGGGGGGKSSWLFEISPRGQIRDVSMVFRGHINTAAWDEWGRIMVGGQGVLRNGRGAIFGYQDGAGVLMASRDWRQSLFQAHFGTQGEGNKVKGQIWSIAIDSELGIAAVAGYMEGDFRGVNPVQERTGGGKDAFMAVWRLWTPEAYEAAIAAERAANDK